MQVIQPNKKSKKIKVICFIHNTFNALCLFLLCFRGSTFLLMMAIRPVGVAQLVEQLLLTPEIRGSNLVISPFYLLSPVFKRRN